MATYGVAANKLVTCPYDKAHKVKESRYQLHIAKCRQNHLENTMEVCPFNAQHRVAVGTLDHHIMHCEDRGPLDRQLAAAASGENGQFRGHTAVPSYHSPDVETNENWDTEASRVPAPGYRPRAEPPNGGIRTDFGFMKPSQRRQYYRNLHGRNPNDTVETEVESVPVLRPPSTVSMAQQREQPKPVHELQNIGLGRGQPVPQSSGTRIAANIFGQKAVVTPGKATTTSKPDVPLANLGMGRGGPPANLGWVRNVNKDVGPAPQIVNVDENQQGFGRGGRK